MSKANSVANRSTYLTARLLYCNLRFVIEREGDAASDWTLDDLSTRAEARLAEMGLLQGSPGGAGGRSPPSNVDGRVARALDPRTVRYYQTLGILDRPHSYEGHKARYGPRHLLQLLA